MRKKNVSKEKRYKANSDYRITVKELLQVAKAQGVEKFEAGDILLIRTGWIKWYLSASLDEKKHVSEKLMESAWAGLAYGEDMLKFLWNNHFAAVASDNPSVEAWPFPQPMADSLHGTLISLWGMPIGELFYCEALSKDCASDGRHVMFLTSAVLNKTGGVASPPNAIALK